MPSADFIGPVASYTIPHLPNDSRELGTLHLEPTAGLPATTTGVLASASVLDHGFVWLLDVMGSDASIVAAARISVTQPKFTQADDKLLNYLMKNKHTSPFEQVQLKFHIKAPLFVIAQWQRHRTWSYNQISARYSEMPTEFYIPALDNLNEQSTSNKQGRSESVIANPSKAQNIIRVATRFSGFAYDLLLKLGVAKEIARIVLPTALYTEMIASVDLHNLLHFLALRADPHAQLEMQLYAHAIMAMIRPRFPATMAAFERHQLGWPL